MSRFCTFEEFFAEVTGYTPYLWQSELAARLAAGQVPGLLDVPTGMGKTSAITCWLWALGLDEHERAAGLRSKRLVQRRFHLVVDRRLLVDSAADLGDRLAAALEQAPRQAPDSAVGQVARALAPLAAADGTVLSVRRLRGGLTERAEHLRDPKVPALITSTVDMLGSRLLWRGYGVSVGRRSIDAALVGTDSIIALDEAHLAPQFLHVLEDLEHQQAACESGFDAAVPGRALMVMTATAGGARPDPLVPDMNSERTASPWLDQRRRQREAMIVRREAETSLEDAVLQSLGQLKPGRAAVVFCNSVATAVTTAKKVQSEVTTRQKAGGVPVRVLTVVGGVPVPVRAEQLEQLVAFATGAGELRAQAPATLVVSTQVLEVGADLDFDIGVSEVAALPALIQRAGRVNRVGARAQGLFRVVGAAAKPAASVYAGAPEQVAQLLQRIDPEGVDMAGFMELVAPHLQDPELSAALDPTHIVGLSPAEFGELLDTRNEATSIEVAKLLRPVQADWQCQVAFRQGLGAILHDDQVIEQYLELVPAVRAEQWSIPTSAKHPAIKVLTGRCVLVLDVAGRARVIAQFDPQEHAGHRLAGSTLVVPADAELAKAHVPGYGSDVYAAASGLRQCLVRAAGLDLADEEVLDELVLAAGLDPAQAQVVDLDGRTVLVGEVSSTQRARAAVRVQLEEHNAEVARTASAWADALGLPPRVRASIELAGARHDAGKCDAGFQYLLHLSARGRSHQIEHVEDGRVLAKSDLPAALGRTGIWLARREGGLVPGFRHEALSVELSARAGYDGHEVDVDLVEHLIATHHGHWHGLGPAVTDERAPALQRADDPAWSTWPSRVRTLQRKYGPYTLALAEALVRLADWECSAQVINEMQEQA